MRRRTGQLCIPGGGGGGSGGSSGSLVDHAAAEEAIWPMTSSNDCPDTSGNGNHLTVLGTPNFLADAIELLTQASDYLFSSDSFLADDTSDWAINIFFEMPASPSYQHALFSFSKSGSYFMVRLNSATSIQISQTGGGDTTSIVTIPSVATGVHMLTVLYNSTSKSFNVFMDKASILGATIATPVDWSTASIYLGIFRLNSTNNNGFLGKFKESRYWKGDGAILSGDAINQLWDEGPR